MPRHVVHVDVRLVAVSLYLVLVLSVVQGVREHTVRSARMRTAVTGVRREPHKHGTCHACSTAICILYPLQL